MSYNPDDFVNRTTEIDAFADLLKHAHLRIFLLHGPEGIGKSCLVGRLRWDTESVLVDFLDPTLVEPEQVIGRLQERIGGDFAARLDQAGVEVLQKLMQEDLKAFTEMFSSLGAKPVGEVKFFKSEEIRVEGDIVGGFKLVLNNSSVTIPIGSGPRRIQEAIERRLNTLFPRALKDLVTEQGRVILVFDHFEKAKEPVVIWLRHHLLNLYLEETRELPNLWIVIAGRKLPFPQEVDQWGYVLRKQRLGPLSDEDVYAFWVEKRGLDRQDLPEIIRDCEGIPLLLLWRAAEATEALKVEK